nr:aldehyde dehydrogenase family 3 member B1 isoform X1 [Oryctolagus cuniculus]XP_051687052.1 aldehyde dehydrogenase family 3 member B1 isoform X1 [Oryctolagus cuniculus]XP_051687053.1 aldehyde dehydrogenase family 3 member B1 isoform X1 [Oryctolagus cuniculus]
MEPLEDRLQRLREAFDAGRTRPAEFRATQLRGLSRFLQENRQLLQAALAQDLHKSAFEAEVSELGISLGEIKLALRKLRAWSQDERVPRNLATQLDSAFIRKEPYGLVLIIAPWNYPVNLTLVPLVGAIAAELLRRGAGGPRGDRAAAGTQIRLHPLHGEPPCGQDRHGGRCQAPDARHPGAGRQEPLLRGRQLRPADRGQPRGLVPLLQRRPDLRGPRLRAVQPRDAGAPAARPAAGHHPFLRRRPPALPQPGPHHQPEAVPAAPGPAGLRPRGHRRPERREPALHRAHGAGGRAGGGAGHAGGDLRAHPAHPDGERPGRGRRLHQPPGEAPGPVRLLQQQPGGEAGAGADQQRGLLRQRRLHAHDLGQPALRRSGPQRHGQLPRQVLLRHLLAPPRLPAAQPGLGEAQRAPLPALLAGPPARAAAGHGRAQLRLRAALSPAPRRASHPPQPQFPHLRPGPRGAARRCLPGLLLGLKRGAVAPRPASVWSLLPGRWG